MQPHEPVPPPPAVADLHWRASAAACSLVGPAWASAVCLAVASSPRTGRAGTGAGATARWAASPSPALAEAVTAQYEQPNFPLPATPSLEFDEGYASTTDNFGPSGSAMASTLYPGQVVANAGPELALLVPGAPLPPAPVWPVQATSEYPQTPNSGSTDEPGVNMEPSSTTNGNTATATLGDDAATAGSNGGDPTLQAPSGSGNPLAGSSAIIGVGGMSATSSSLGPQHLGQRPGQRDRLGDLHPRWLHHHRQRHLDRDGHLGRHDGEGQRIDRVQNMDIAGEAVTVDANGISAAGQSTPLPCRSRPSTRCSASWASPCR